MIKSFVWTLIFWSLFILFNTVGDAIDFYAVFPWYGNMDLWHFLKYFWIGFAVLTGCGAIRLYDEMCHQMPFKASDIKKYKLKVVGVLVFFLLWRWGLHEALMWKWRSWGF